MSFVKEVYQVLCEFAPENLADDWDPIGPQVYFPQEKVRGILLCLDVTDKVLEEAINQNCNVIVSHHPMFFKGLQRIDIEDYKSNLIYQALKEKISILSAHTNLDRTENGVNDALAEKLGLKDLEPLYLDDQGRNLGYLAKGQFKTMGDLLARLEDLVQCRDPIIYGRLPRSLEKIAILGGSGAEFLDTAIQAGADLLITGDVKYHDGQDAYEKNFCLIDIGHYDSEKYVLEKLQDLFKEEKTVLYESCDFIIQKCFLDRKTSRC